MSNCFASAVTERETQKKSWKGDRRKYRLESRERGDTHIGVHRPRQPSGEKHGPGQRSHQATDLEKRRVSGGKIQMRRENG